MSVRSAAPVAALLPLIISPGIALAQADSFFNEPEKLCNALEGQGFDTRQWRYSETGEYNCLTTYIEVAPSDGYQLPTNIAYYVSGMELDSAEIAQIVLNINDESTRRQGVERFQEATEALFAAINSPIPEDISAALENPKVGSQPTDVVVPTDFGKAILIYENNGMDTLKAALLREGSDGLGYIPSRLR